MCDFFCGELATGETRSGRGLCRKAENGKQKTENRRQKTGDRRQKAGAEGRSRRQEQEEAKGRALTHQQRQSSMIKVPNG
jgi:hypothetical protein